MLKGEVRLLQRRVTHSTATTAHRPVGRRLWQSARDRMGMGLSVAEGSGRVVGGGTWKKDCFDWLSRDKAGEENEVAAEDGVKGGRGESEERSSGRDRLRGLPLGSQSTGTGSVGAALQLMLCQGRWIKMQEAGNTSATHARTQKSDPKCLTGPQ